MLLDHRTATTARLRSVGGVHERHLTLSIYRFVSQQRLEHSQPSTVSAERQVRIAQQKSELEVFECDQTVGVSQPKGELVIKVAADVGDVFMQLGDQQALILAPLAALVSATVPSDRLSSRSKPISAPIADSHG